MRLTPSLRWSAGARQPTAIDPRIFELLAHISSRGSLRAAAATIVMPYRPAWRLLQEMEALAVDIGPAAARVRGSAAPAIREPSARVGYAPAADDEVRPEPAAVDLRREPEGILRQVARGGSW